jgi:hypothetical protein
MTTRQDLTTILNNLHTVQEDFFPNESDLTDNLHFFNWETTWDTMKQASDNQELCSKEWAHAFKQLERLSKFIPNDSTLVLHGSIRTVFVDSLALLGRYVLEKDKNTKPFVKSRNEHINNKINIVAETASCLTDFLLKPSQQNSDKLFIKSQHMQNLLTPNQMELEYQWIHGTSACLTLLTAVSILLRSPLIIPVVDFPALLGIVGSVVLSSLYTGLAWDHISKNYFKSGERQLATNIINVANPLCGALKKVGFWSLNWVQQTPTHEPELRPAHAAVLR